jgi:hypothetical protein
MKTDKQYKPELYDLRRPSHLLANDVLQRIGYRNGVEFGRDSLADVEQLVKQFYAEIEKAAR